MADVAANPEALNVEADGMVDVRVSLFFDEDMKLRVPPDVAERLLSGELDGADVDDIPGIDFAQELSSLRVTVESTYEGAPPRLAVDAAKARAALKDGEDDEDDDEEDEDDETDVDGEPSE